MSESSDEHYRYVYLSLICERYEKAAKRSGTREGAMAAFWHSTQACRMAVASTEDSINKFRRFNDDIAAGARAAVDRSNSEERVAIPSKTASDLPDEKAGSGLACDFENNVNLGDPSQDSSLNFSIGGTAAEFTVQEELQKTFDKLNISPDVVTAEELLDYFDTCLDCDLKVEFSWQIQPLNLLMGFEDFLKDIEDIIDEILGALNPMDMLADICDFFDGFSLICIPDLVMLLLALAMLIKKYVMLGISFSFDWTMIVGPIIKWIVDAIAALLQQIMQMLLAPIDCAIGVLQSVQEVIDAADELQDTMMAAGQAIAGQATLGLTPLGGVDASASPTAGITSTTAPNMPGGWMGGEVEGSERWTESGNPIETAQAGFSLARDVTNSAGAAVSDATAGFLSFDRNSGSDAAEGAASLTIPTGFTVGATDTFQTFFDKRKKAKKEGTNKVPAIGDITVFKKAILAIQDFRQMLVDFFSQILFVVKSLNAIFGGKLALNVEAMGIIMLIIDLIKAIQIIIMLKKAGLASCDEIRDNPEKLMDALRVVYPDKLFKISTDGLSIEAEDNLYRTTIPLPECSTNLSDEEKASIRNRVSKITGTTQ